MARTQNDYPIGERLAGTKYVVVRKLGRGGMGTVLEVVKEPGIRGVVKIIHPFLAAEAEFRTRFFDEVRILAGLEHPNIVRVTDYDTLTTGTPFYAMELLNGSTVRQVLKAMGVIPPAHLYQIMRGMLDGLDYVHTHTPPIVHRDIKSENVFIHTPAFGDPCVKLIDFGVAGGEAIVEKKGLFVGTPRYAAPEQLRGEPPSPKADLYSAGLVLYEALVGQGPFDDYVLSRGKSSDPQRAFIQAHLSVDPPSILTHAPWLPESVDEILRSVLSKDPAQRPESAHAFASKLYVLQFLTDKTLGRNTTVQNLVTMAELSGVAERPPESVAPASEQTALGPPAQGGGLPTRSMNDTVVDPSPPLFELLEASRVASLQTSPDDDSTELDAPFALASPVARPPGPRSFAEAEAAMAAKAQYGAPAQRPPTPRPAAGSGRPFIDASRAAPTSPGVARPAKRKFPWTLVLIGLGIPILNAILFGAYLWMKPSQATPAPSTKPEATTTRVLTPLPAEAPPTPPARAQHE